MCSGRSVAALTLAVHQQTLRHWIVMDGWKSVTGSQILKCSVFFSPLGQRAERAHLGHTLTFSFYIFNN